MEGSLSGVRTADLTYKECALPDELLEAQETNWSGRGIEPSSAWKG